jgi:hypothetical protein
MIDLPEIEWGQEDRGWRWFLIGLLVVATAFASMKDAEVENLTSLHHHALSEFRQCLYVANERVDQARDLVEAALLYGQGGS